MIKTERFSIPAAVLARRRMMSWLARWWWALALPLLAAMLAGCYDWRWWVAILALMLVLYPGMLAIGFYHCALSPEATAAVISHRVEIDSEGIRLVYEPPRSDRYHSMSAVQKASEEGGSFIINIGGKDACQIDIPYSSLSGKEEIDELRTLLTPFFEKY